MYNLSYNLWAEGGGCCHSQGPLVHLPVHLYVHIKGLKGLEHVHLKGVTTYKARPLRLPAPQLAHQPAHLNVHLMGMDPAWARKSDS